MQEISEQQLQLSNDYIQNMFMYPTTNINGDIQSNYQTQMSPNCVNNTDFPFVRIHAFDIPISNEINTGFNIIPATYNSTNNREIKPKIESIKSELSEANIGGNGSPQERNCNLSISSKVHNCSQKLKIIKCKYCMFLTISPFNMENHLSTIHENLIQNNGNVLGTKMSCPGCDNHFYSEIPLYSHLKHDHFMIEGEIAKLSEYREKQNDSRTENRILFETMDYIHNPKNQPITISYIKTASEPLNCNSCCDYESGNELNFIDLINEDNLFYNKNDDMVDRVARFSSSKISKPKQNITIKSVEHLQEPLFLRKVQHFKNNDKFINLTLDQSGKKNYDIDYCDEVHISGYNLTNNNPEVEMERKKPRKGASKIYIKNVDILKEPILLPPTNISNILNMNETLHFDNFPSKEMSVSPPTLPYIYPPGTDIDNNNTDIVEAQIRQFINDQFSVDSYTNNYCHKNHLVSQNNKIKVNITNDDISKQQFHTSPTKRITNFLHLRTVDELNLMNKNQINLMNNLQNIPDNSKCLEASCAPLESSKKTGQNGIYNNYLISPVTEHILGNAGGELIQNNRYINLETGDSTSSLKNYQLQYPADLNTLHLLMDERTPSENEREMLLDCAEELILNQEKDTNNAIYNESYEKIFRQNMNVIEADITNKRDTERPFSKCVAELKKQINDGNFVVIPDESTCGEDILNSNINNSQTVEISASEKGRIYVSDNLMGNRIVGTEVCSSTEGVLLNNVKKRTKGRPLGAKTSRAIKFNKFDQNKTYNINFKCDVIDCTVRFKRMTTMEYHKKCHKSNIPHSTIQCPECFSAEFSNWNTLHTHLWRLHNVDMELYNCELCSFKTPILSRLYNTHLKIHSNERNFKCDLCEKAFKNSKQLKNHRRLHRSWTKPLELHKCELCSSAFSNIKSKMEHFCHPIQVNTVIASKCSICDKLCSSKSALKLHLSTHKESSKFKCNKCNYITNDHNAFRRHKSTHDKTMMYECPYCGYKCIQSILYKKHLTTKHPDLACNIIHKCNVCQFTTINQIQFHVHLAKHENENLSLTVSYNNSENYLMEDDLESINLDDFGNKSEPLLVQSHQKNKIKVKSDLVLTDPTKFLLQTSNDCIT